MSEPQVPVIPNIHQRVYEAASQPGALYMNRWHHSCGTVHCRAGWVIHLAGEAGYKFEVHKRDEYIFQPYEERRFSIAPEAQAAIAIYEASSPIPVGNDRFYDRHDEALADMKRCADLEQAMQAQEVAR